MAPVSRVEPFLLREETDASPHCSGRCFNDDGAVDRDDDSGENGGVNDNNGEYDDEVEKGVNGKVDGDGGDDDDEEEEEDDDVAGTDDQSPTRNNT
ncbi:hypothetical protein P879_06006 [Paragonimus westermani]|uniref:Uncharacterized protein n=1 Tax=Paragonimus westermani TaxID=34504 RepID=A0A8T0D187_9TREM|nr:hypothetical protein P879_06006 [Paragonimus westermani]